MWLLLSAEIRTQMCTGDMQMCIYGDTRRRWSVSQGERLQRHLPCWHLVPGFPSLCENRFLFKPLVWGFVKAAPGNSTEGNVMCFIVSQENKTLEKNLRSGNLNQKGLISGPLICSSSITLRQYMTKAVEESKFSVFTNGRWGRHRAGTGQVLAWSQAHPARVMVGT